MINIDFIKYRQNITGEDFGTCMYRHPYVRCVALSICMPALLLGVVCICTTIVMLPVSFVMGWI